MGPRLLSQKKPFNLLLLIDILVGLRPCGLTMLNRNASVQVIHTIRPVNDNTNLLFSPKSNSLQHQSTETFNTCRFIVTKRAWKVRKLIHQKWLYSWSNPCPIIFGYGIQSFRRFCSHARGVDGIVEDETTCKAAWTVHVSKIYSIRLPICRSFWHPWIWDRFKNNFGGIAIIRDETYMGLTL